MWITTNCGKFWKRWEYQTTWPASWEICIQVKKQQLKLDMELHTASKSRKKYIKAVYCHTVYLTYMQSTSWETMCWKKHKLESRLPGEISITSYMQMPWSSFSECWVLSQHFHSPLTFIKRLFSSSLLSAIMVVLSAYLRLLLFIRAIFLLACDSCSPAFCVMYSAYKFNKQGDNMQPWHTPFPIWNQSVVPCLDWPLSSQLLYQWWSFIMPLGLHDIRIWNIP